MPSSTPPSFTLRRENDRHVIALAGDWTVAGLGRVDAALRALDLHKDRPVIDVGALGRFDTAGAFVIDRTVRENCDLEDPPQELIGTHPTAAQLLAEVRAAAEPCETGGSRLGGVLPLLERTGSGLVSALNESLSTLSFLGETLVTCLSLLAHPFRIRWTATVAVMEEAGLDALPIVAFLSFFVGMVVAFIGATTLQEFGATIFVVELVGISMLREFGVVLTAIILAGRTNSAFTAQIGAMKMRQEIDAMTTLGLSPMRVLVAPRVFAMLVMTPILAFVATLAGIAGGVVVGWLALDINPNVFLGRMQAYVPIENFWVGLSKAPVFGLVVALIGCRQGLMVGGSVQSLGAATTQSVVQAIFSIIVIDAVFAMFYMELGI